jgi:hypothetical protein
MPTSHKIPYFIFAKPLTKQQPKPAFMPPLIAIKERQPATLKSQG